MAKKSMAPNGAYPYHQANGDDPKNPEKDDEGGSCGKGCCSISCLKFSLYFFNVLFLLTGLLLVGVGLWTLLEKHPSLVLLTSGLYDLTGYIVILAGK